MRHLALFTLAASLSAATLLQAQTGVSPAPALDPQVIQADREFLKSQPSGPATIPGVEQPALPARTIVPPARAAESAPLPEPIADSGPAVRPKASRKEAPTVARSKPATAARPESIASKESKVTRVAPKTKAAPAPAPKVATRDRVVRAIPVETENVVPLEGGYHPPRAIDRRDRDEEDDDDDAEEAAESAEFHRTVGGFFHRLFGR